MGSAEVRHPLVSVVTPCFNSERHIQRCLDSVRRQSYQDVQHIVIDGGSTDGTVALLAKTNGVEWISEPDNGQTDAINKGFSRATGQVLTWLNADDALLPRTLEQVVDVYRRDSELTWVSGRSAVRRAGKGQRIEPVFRVRNRDLDFGNPIVQPSTFFTRTGLEKAGGLNPDLHYVMDLDLWLRFVDLGLRRVFLPDVLSDVVYDKHSKTGGHDPALFFKEEFLVYRRHRRADAALLALGRVAAYDAVREPPITRQSLDRAIARARQWAETSGTVVGGEELCAAAQVEACFAELHLRHGLRAVRHVRHWDTWRHRPGRARVLHGFRRKAIAPLVELLLRRAHTRAVDEAGL